MNQFAVIAVVCTCLAAASVLAAEPAQISPALQTSIDELRHAHGAWDVTTTFFGPDGKPAKAAQGTYRFEWAVPDRVLTGSSQIPELKMGSGILFFVNERKGFIQMNSVGSDGTLWTMKGPLGGDMRETAPVPMSDGTSQTLRFTRFNVAPDRFESKMEVSSDGGKTWTPGNHQLFKRKS